MSKARAGCDFAIHLSTVRSRSMYSPWTVQVQTTGPVLSTGNGETPRPEDTTTRQEFLSCESRKNDLHAETAAILGRHLIDWVPDSDLYDL